MVSNHPHHHSSVTSPAPAYENNNNNNHDVWIFIQWFSMYSSRTTSGSAHTDRWTQAPPTEPGELRLRPHSQVNSGSAHRARWTQLRHTKSQPLSTASSKLKHFTQGKSLWCHHDIIMTSLWHYCDVIMMSSWRVSALNPAPSFTLCLNEPSDRWVTSTEFDLWPQCDLSLTSDPSVTFVWPLTPVWQMFKSRVTAVVHFHKPVKYLFVI